MRRLLLVTNPFAQRVTPVVKQQVETTLSAAFDVELVETKGPAHATELAFMAAECGAEVVAALGGDGTLNEVVNGVVGSGIPIAVLPGGGANVLARHLGLPLDPTEACQRLIQDAHREPRKIPLGRAEGRYFVSNCGMGFDAEIVRRVELNPDRKHRVGHWYFVWKGIQSFYGGYDRRRPHITLTWGTAPGAETTLHDLFLAVVQNLDPFTYLGKRPLRLCPDAAVDEGLDCFCVDTMRLARVLPILLSALGKAGHPTNKHVTCVRNQPRYSIGSDQPLPFQMDGEYIGPRTHVLVEAIRDALAVIS